MSEWRPDHCGLCGEELRHVPDLAWQGMKSPEGILAASNFCKNSRCEQAAQREAPHVVAYQRLRQRDIDHGA
jgi:hypothetical protein